jgi:hypothetical protein
LFVHFFFPSYLSFSLYFYLHPNVCSFFLSFFLYFTLCFV